MTTLLLTPTTLEAQGIFGKSPAPRELLSLDDFPGSPTLGVCGFGLPMAAALTAHFLQQEPDGHVILLGIAGSYDATQAKIASVYTASWVDIYGLGAGSGRLHQCSDELGFPLQSSLGLAARKLPLQPSRNLKQVGIISVTAASANSEEAEQNRSLAEDALLEDMETYGVALSCHLANRQLTVLRAVSNVAGQRDTKSWKFKEAFLNLRHELSALLGDY